MRLFPAVCSADSFVSIPTPTRRRVRPAPRVSLPFRSSRKRRKLTIVSPSSSHPHPPLQARSISPAQRHCHRQTSLLRTPHQQPRPSIEHQQRRQRRKRDRLAHRRHVLLPPRRQQRSPITQLGSSARFLDVPVDGQSRLQRLDGLGSAQGIAQGQQSDHRKQPDLGFSKGAGLRHASARLQD